MDDIRKLDEEELEMVTGEWIWAMMTFLLLN